MGNNTEININSLPILHFKRSKYTYRKNYKTTFNTGDLITIYANELIQPGDTFKIDVSSVTRMITPYQPVMDNAYMEIFAFSCKWLDLWNKTKQFWGENPLGAWNANQVEYTVPQIKIPANTTIESHTLLAYLGFPQHEINGEIIVGGGLSVNMYNFTYNEWFRNQNYIAPKEINFDGVTITYDENDSLKGGKVLKVQKYKDRFIAGLPEPSIIQEQLPLGIDAPIKSVINVDNGTTKYHFLNEWASFNTNTPAGQDSYTDSFPVVGQNVVAGGEVRANGVLASGSTDQNGKAIYPGWSEKAIYADLTQATAATISALRLASAMQQIGEILAMYGRRYREIVRSAWGCSVSDQNNHIPEFLGSKKIPINIQQVVQVANGGDTDLGSTGAMSLTADFWENAVVKSFDEWSVLMFFACVRTSQTYGQGLPRQYFKQLRFDYYWNKFAGLSFQPVYVGELYLTGDMTANKTALSFLPAWSEYRNEVNQLTGHFNPDNPLFLEQWTYANKFTEAPSMGQSFLEESTVNVDRTLTNTSQNVDNFWTDIEFIITKITEVPFYGLPGIEKI